MLEKIGRIFIFSNHEMEGFGIKHILDENLSENKLVIRFINKPITILLEEKEKYLRKDSLIILDVDSDFCSEIFVLLKKLEENSIHFILYSRSKNPGFFLASQKFVLGGYVSKFSQANKIIDCVTSVIHGGIYYDACFCNLIHNLRKFEKALSSQELKIFELALLFPQQNLPELSKVAEVSKHTVEVHLSNIYKKADVKKYEDLITKFTLV